MATKDTKHVLIAVAEFDPSPVIPGVTGSGRNGKVLPGDVIDTDDEDTRAFLKANRLALPPMQAITTQRAALTEDGTDFTHTFTPQPNGTTLLRRGVDGKAAPEDDAESTFDVIDAEGSVTHAGIKGRDAAIKKAAGLADPVAPTTGSETLMK